VHADLLATCKQWKYVGNADVLTYALRGSCSNTTRHAKGGLCLTGVNIVASPCQVLRNQANWASTELLCAHVMKRKAPSVVLLECVLTTIFLPVAPYLG
jgi:hypothetical protein